MDLAESFTKYQELLDADQTLREEIRSKVRELDTKSREISLLLQNMHQPSGINNISDLCQKARDRFSTAITHLRELASLIPHHHYYHFNDHWRGSMQRICYLVTLLVYLESDRLASHTEVAEFLGVSPSERESFHLDLEDYLTGVLMLASELSRLSVNSVTAGNYEKPISIARFVANLNAGFRLLNLKNDNLRKKFDALKYDVKKTEEVVYDLTIRGLRSRTSDE